MKADRLGLCPQGRESCDCDIPWLVRDGDVLGPTTQVPCVRPLAKVKNGVTFVKRWECLSLSYYAN